LLRTAPPTPRRNAPAPAAKATPRTLMCRPFSPCCPRGPPPLLPAEPAGGVVVRIKSPLKKKSKKKKNIFVQKTSFRYSMSFFVPILPLPCKIQNKKFQDQIQSTDEGGKDKAQV
jgi:hypothetical protein